MSFKSWPVSRPYLILSLFHTVRTHGLEQIHSKSKGLFAEKSARTRQFLFLVAYSFMVNESGPKEWRPKTPFSQMETPAIISFLNFASNSMYVSCIMFKSSKLKNYGLRLISFKLCEDVWIGPNSFKIQGCFLKMYFRTEHKLN